MKLKNTCTNWFSASVKPVRVGVYKRNYGEEGVVYNHWNGKFWGIYGNTPNEAYMCRNDESFVKKAWCGLANNQDANGG